MEQQQRLPVRRYSIECLVIFLYYAIQYILIIIITIIIIIIII